MSSVSVPAARSAHLVALPGASAAPGAAPGDVRRRELGAFLRSRRERIAPEQVGLPPAGRRRTPGLRREEVAQLSGVGVTWYTWLEQGRDINASEQVLGALARTLLLSGAERTHLFTLAGVGESASGRECNAVTDAQRRVLEAIAPFPACVQSGKYDLLAYNRQYAALLGLDTLPGDQHNCLWLMFVEPSWRELFVEWEAGAPRMVAGLRSLMADHVADGEWKAFVAALCEASPDFRTLWEQHEVLPVENKTKHIRHPEHGLLTFDTTNSWLGPRPGSRMLVYVPADERTEQIVTVLGAS